MVTKRKHNPLVSVIMNCRNCDKYLREAVDSVYSQSYQEWEIIFWDNDSIDGSANIVQDYGDSLKYFRSECSTSLGEARNNALKQVSGDYVAFLDTDDVWLPDKLEKQVDLMESNPELSFVFSDTIFFDHQGDRYKYFSVVSPKRGDVASDLICNGFISTETLMVRRSSLDEIGFEFNKNFTMVMDYDLTIRLSLIGSVDYIEEPLSKWRMHDTSTSVAKRFSAYHEIEEMLDLLSVDITDFQNLYHGDVGYRRARNNYFFALEGWESGDKLKAAYYALRSNGLFNRLFLPVLILLMSFNLYQSFVDFQRQYKTNL